MHISDASFITLSAFSLLRRIEGTVKALYLLKLYFSFSH